jgi:regulator of cell morphogenesis and NO signaling
VFLARGLDFCCRGRRPLAEACAERGLDPRAVLAEIDAQEPGPDELLGWEDRPLADLVAFIVERFHHRTRTELVGLTALAEKVERVHADKPDCPRGLAAHLREVARDLVAHMDKEELVVFPKIRAGLGATCTGSIRSMEHEHEDAGRGLARIRELTADLVPPAEACTSWRALYLRLSEFERELVQHVHLENNVLFPRALGA